jgi:hypothetical protein
LKIQPPNADVGKFAPWERADDPARTDANECLGSDAARDVDWSEFGFMIVDLAPGTGTRS